MHFAVRRLRYKGRPLPKHEWMNRPAAIGDLRVEQMFDEELRRYLRMARVVNVGPVKDPDELPPLHEPLLVAMSSAAFSHGRVRAGGRRRLRPVVASVGFERLGTGRIAVNRPQSPV